MSGNYFSNDTIAAVATSLAGDGGVGIIRLSGPDAMAAAGQICRGLDEPKPRYLQRIEVLDADGAVLDDGLAVVFAEGQSFTGEQVVELQLHGGRFLLQVILQRLIGTGRCRLALPGEFSFRAVRNGKLSLSGAQAVGQIIGARSLFEVEAARRTLSKSRFERFERLGARIRDLLAQTELSIDFSDQDIEVISAAKLRAELAAMLTDIGLLLKQLQAAQRLASGVKVSLIGAPNAGKSTLFNALLAEERAIVSEEAGTTRDVITEEIAVGPYHVRLADTAGLRDAEGQIEREGVARARDLASGSDLIVFVADGTRPGIELAGELRRAAPRQDAIAVINKTDLVEQPAAEALTQALKPLCARVVLANASSGDGVGEVLEALREVLDSRYGIGRDAFLPTEFQLQMLLGCRDSLGAVVKTVDSTGLTHPELIAAGLAGAARALSDLLGETTPDTVLTKIFSEFCIGK